ncbi:MAG TPA: DUF3667 domain-containing protein [Longimicrobiales bacterium]
MTEVPGPDGETSAPATPPGTAPPLSEQPCLNCGDPVPGNYCRMCGQRKAEHRVSVRRLLADALQDQFSLTSELPRTFKALAFRPGFLTTEYARGRIASYIPPFRVYLVTSIVFFLLLSLQASGRGPFGGGEGNFNFNITTDSTASGEPVADSVGGRDGDRGDSRDTVRSQENPGPLINTPFDALDAKLKAKAAVLSKNPDEFRERLKEYMLRRTPTMMFVLLPVFALIMKLFYWRRYYAEHFIYSLHTHAFAFMIFTALALLPDAGAGGVLSKVLFAWLMVYPLIALRRVYAQGWMLTFVKYLVVGSIYVVVFGLAMYVQTVIALLLL